MTKYAFWYIFRYPASRASISSLSSLFDVFSVGRFRSKILALPGFGHFSVEHARTFHDNTKIFSPIKLILDRLYRNIRSKDLWNGTLVCYICSKDLRNGAHDATLLANWKSRQNINLSNRSKSTGSLESSPSFRTGTSKEVSNTGRVGLQERLMEI